MVHWTPTQRESLEQIRDQPLSRKQRYHREILLRADQGDTDQEIAAELGIHVATAQRTRRRFAQEGLDAALADTPRSGTPPKMDGTQEAMVGALACSEAPDGQARWAVRLLRRRLVEREVAAEVSRETVRRLRKKPR